MTGNASWGARFAAAGAGTLNVYDELMVPRLFAPWANLLLDHVGLMPGESLLDVATGPGTVARLAAIRAGGSGRVVACDFSPAMLGMARNKPPQPDAAPISYLECRADALDVPSDSMDAVICQQGLQFFPDRPAALAEMRRAARAGARLGIAVWSGIDESPAFEALAQAIGAVLGDAAAASYRAGPWGLPDRGEVALLVESAGFSDVTVTREELPHTFDDGARQLVATLSVTAVGPQVAALDDAGRNELVRVVERAAASMIDSGGTVHSSAVAHIARAQA